MALAAGAAVATGLTGVALAPAAATSGYCTGAGVNVLVDFTGQGGGITRACAPQGAGGSAWNAFEQAGVSLTPVQRYPGAVCRVDGRPADASCVNMPPQNAYWGFFTSRGGGWTYASVGPNSYRVADGDTIAFAWQSGTQRAPAAAPATPHRAPAPSPTARATTAPHRHAHAAPSRTANTTTPRAGTSTSAAASGSAPAGSRSPSTGTKPTGGPPGHRVRAHHVPAATSKPTAPSRPTATPTAGSDASAAAAPSAASTTPVTSTAATTSGGVPWWAPVLVLVLLAGAGGAVAWRRRGGLR